MLDPGFEEVAIIPHLLAEGAVTAFDTERAALGSGANPASQITSLAQLWSLLGTGALSIIDDFLSAERCYLVVRAHSERSLEHHQARGVAVLRGVLTEGCQKIVAFKLGIAPSTVAQLVATGLSAIGLSRRVQQMPYIVAAAANASHEAEGPALRCSLLPSVGSAQECVLSIPRPEALLVGRLSSSVLSVTRCFLEGMSRARIARIRGRSERTVANQLAVAFKQLRAASRLDLLRVLARMQ